MDWKNKKSIVYLKPSVKLESKIAGFDLDHTLIRPKDGRTHPKDETDWELYVPDLKEYLDALIFDGFSIVIFSNQSSFGDPKKKEIIISRLEQFITLMELPIHVLISTESDYCRKPNIGMWDEFFGDKTIDLTESFYVGDAAGRTKNPLTKKKDFACSDRMFASNLGIKFETPEKYFLEETFPQKEIFSMPRIWETFPTEQPPFDPEDYEVIVLIGPPGSGKSSFVESLSDFIVVSRDILRYKAKCIKLMNDVLKTGGKVIVDNTNPSRDTRKDYLAVAKTYGKKVLAVQINVTKKQSMFLVNYRCKKNKTKRIPDVAIHTYFKKYEKPIKGEGFDKIVERNFVPEGDLSLFQQYF